MPKNSEAENQEKSGKKDKPKKKKLLMIILIVLVVLAGSSAGAYFYFKPSGAAADPKTAKAAKTAETESLDMGDMVVNLAGNGGSHYLRVKITMEYPKDKKLAAELKAKQYQIKDVLITALRSKTLQEVSSANAIPGLKDVLLKEINNNLTSGEVTGIYFTDFLVQ